jgi:hypothetical protein
MSNEKTEELIKKEKRQSLQKDSHPDTHTHTSNFSKYYILNQQ